MPLLRAEAAATSTRARSRFATRNRLRATIARSESNFESDIEELPVIGKSNE